VSERVPSRITHAAVRFRGVVYSLPPPNRHHHVLWLIVERTGVEYVDSEEQGFLDEAGEFLDRERALAAALHHGQVRDPGDVRAERLFSEDLW